MNNWYPDFESRVLEQIKDSKGSDLRFFRIEEYLRNAERIDIMADDCPSCAKLREKMEQQAPNIKQAIDEPGAHRRALDDIQAELNQHLKKAHGFYPPMYHTYMQSIYWLLGFMFAALLAVKIFPRVPSIAFYSPAFVIGVVIGQIKGGKMDRLITKNNKQL
ncbi:MAG: hypothetical protein ACK5JS_00765 [Mangrovibacterium sp.]